MSIDVIHAEWIGKHIRVTRSLNKHQEGIEGTIADETQELIIIETARGTKRVPKRGTQFAIDGETVDGDSALTAPCERIKQTNIHR